MFPFFNAAEEIKKITEIEIEMFDLTKRVLKIIFMQKPGEIFKKTLLYFLSNSQMDPID
jgi:hypothetical protein